MSQSYKACLHAAIEDPQWRGNFSGVHAACAGAHGAQMPHHGGHCSGSVQPNGQFSFDCTEQVGPHVLPPSAAAPSGVRPIPPFIPVFPPAMAPAPAPVGPIPPFIPVFPPAMAPAPAAPVRPIPPFIPVFPPAVAPAPAAPVRPIPPFIPVFPPAAAPAPGAAPGHGCIIGAGYTWCPTTQKCQRPWEEPCPGMPMPPSSAPISPPGVAPMPNIPLGPGGQRNYFGDGLPYVPSQPGALKNELSSPFQSSGGVLWRDDPNLFNQFDPFGTAMPLNTYSNDRGGRFSQFYTNGMF